MHCDASTRAGAGCACLGENVLVERVNHEHATGALHARLYEAGSKWVGVRIQGGFDVTRVHPCKLAAAPRLAVELRT
jgi:hypothetical protein